MTGRRTVLAAMSILLAAPRLQAQVQRAPRKLGYLHPRTIAPNHPTLTILRAQWQESWAMLKATPCCYAPPATT